MALYSDISNICSMRCFPSCSPNLNKTDRHVSSRINTKHGIGIGLDPSSIGQKNMQISFSAFRREA